MGQWRVERGPGPGLVASFLLPRLGATTLRLFPGTVCSHCAHSCQGHRRLLWAPASSHPGPWPQPLAPPPQSPTGAALTPRGGLPPLSSCSRPALGSQGPWPGFEPLGAWQPPHLC